jgi:phosphoribosylformylglycinamidine synthase subunit PurQ / glutaminase
MSSVRTLILRAPGTNCDEESAFAFQQAGSLTTLAHINQMANSEVNFSSYQILVFPGGFSYGDDLGAGKVLANELTIKLRQEIEPFIEHGGLVMGICNGFQVLVKAGILPGPISAGQSITLTNNDSGKFECRWVYLKVNPQSKCVFTRDIEALYLPIAHGEGKLVASPEILTKLDAALYYCDEAGKVTHKYPYNPNGSMNSIAGLTDATGRIFALMPHPERHIRGTQHPRWVSEGDSGRGDGLKIFQNAVGWVKSL